MVTPLTALVPTERLPLWRLAAWAGAGLAAAANFNLCNAFFGLGAAPLVDRSPETRFGKARPCEFADLGIGLATWLLFSTPSPLSEAGPIAWVFATFISIQAVFDTRLRANDNLYMARAFHCRRVFAKVTTALALLPRSAPSR